MFCKIKKYVRDFQSFHYIVVILAVALQMHVTLFTSDNSYGLRVGLADLLLPILGVFVLYSLITKKSNWPQYSLPFAVFWLIALVIVMSSALLNGYIVNGFLSSWAFVNKYIGFLLLISYFMLGGWVITNVRDTRYLLSLFMSVFSGFFVITLCFSTLALFLQYLPSFPLSIHLYSWDGFMANRNAFMVIFVITFTFIIWGYSDSKTIIPSWVRLLFWLNMPMFFVFNDSRTGWIAAAVLFIVLFLKEPVSRTKLILPILLLGMLVAYSSYYVTKNTIVLQGRQAQHLLALLDVDADHLVSLGKEVDYFGDQKRYIAVEDGIELFQDNNPLVGAGLGTYKYFQIEKRGGYIDVMDFTALWLLVETGAVGLSVFIAFFIACALCLYRRGYIVEKSNYHRAMLAFLIIFAAMSILHELTYMRIFWFAMGLGLARSAIMYDKK